MVKLGYIKLLAPRGTDEASFGAERFKIHEDGSLWVTPEAVRGFTETGAGFVLAPVEAVEPEPEPATLTLSVPQG